MFEFIFKIFKSEIKGSDTMGMETRLIVKPVHNILTPKIYNLYSKGVIIPIQSESNTKKPYL